MTVDQLPEEAREFAHHLGGLLARLDQDAGWAGVFWQRDPDGMRDCVEGREVPPWDVVEALLQDLAAAYGARAAEQEAERVRPLHAAALVAHDDRPGGREALGDRLDVMLREQRYAAERQAELGRLLAAATTPGEADALRLDLAWARDDHARATARCAELRRRMAEHDHRARQRADHRRRADPGRTATAHPSDPPATAPAYAAGSTGPVGGTNADGFAGRGEFAGPAGPAGGGDAVGPAGRGGPAGPAGLDGPVVARDALGTTVSADAGGPDRAAADAYGATAADRPATGGRAPLDRDWADAGAHPDTSAHYEPAHAPAAHDPAHTPAPHGTGPDPHQPASAEPPASAPTPTVPKQRKRRRGSARFAGMAQEDVAAVPVPAQADGGPALPGLGPAPAPAARRGLRGARFAGAAAEPEAPSATRPRETGPVDDRARQEAARAVERLVSLRTRGLSGEAHALLVELAYWPAAHVPLLAAELQHAGLGADWATLLWEAASLPVERLVAAADALLAAGRADDAEQILRQGVGRPAEEIGEAVRGLAAEGRHREVRALLDAYVRVRAPEEAARSAAPEPRTLVPLLLDAARGVSDTRYWDLVHALRVAGHHT
ncbi:hypothetical protein ACIP10_15600 [Streptomyces galbus]|uniref:hypothetical protein n=1 Tax=Streptomyces galbus TaxID=33898 RepID=UPI003793A7B0